MLTTGKLVPGWIGQRAFASLGTLGCFLLGSCSPSGNWKPIAEPNVIVANDTAVIESAIWHLSIKGFWSSSSIFVLKLENKTAQTLELDLSQTLFMLENSATGQKEYGLEYAARARNVIEKEGFVTILGPASDYEGRVLGDVAAPNEVLTLKADQTALFRLAFEFLPSRERESYGRLRIVLGTEGQDHIAEARFRAKR